MLRMSIPMMSELRWALLILGVLFIALLLWWERRRPRQATRGGIETRYWSFNGESAPTRDAGAPRDAGSARDGGAARDRGPTWDSKATREPGPGREGVRVMR